jgi:hypothetical protein
MFMDHEPGNLLDYEAFFHEGDAMISRRFFQAAGLILLAAALPALLFYTSCDENPADVETDLNLSKVSGDGQSERAGAQLPERLVVAVTNSLGDEQQGIEITFSTANPGAHVYPETAVTDQNGRASCYFVLGSEIGLQHATAVFETDSTTFAATAIEVPCTEADPTPSDDWSMNSVYYVTTSSALLTTGNSVLVEFDTDTDTRTKILETSHTLTDVAFSSRGELFVASSGVIYKVNATTKTLEDYSIDAWMTGHVELDANQGGILAGLSFNGPFGVNCTPTDPTDLYPGGSFVSMRPENFTADPVSRDLFFISGSTPTYKLYRVPWDGRSGAGATSLHADINITDNAPRGMCIDYSGNIYITIDGTDNYRRIIKIYADGTIDYDFFDFFDYFGNLDMGRWGDITLLYGSLYLIDTDKNRIVEIGTNGTYVREVGSTDFSGPGTPGETYGITAKLQPPETAP